jgi:carboxypeptidase Taq
VQGLAYQAWTEARPANDFSILEPHLRRLFDLKKQEADAIGWEEERYDALLDDFEPGMTTVEVEAMFSELIKGIKPLADEAVYAAGDRPTFLVGSFDPERQHRFCEWLAEKIGFDTKAGLVAQSPHPFTIQISRGDVRQTIRTDPKTLLPSVYTTLHETGHALYEQGLPDDLSGLPAGRTPSLGMHESQSRLWENHVGRSRPFTDWLLPHLKELFEDQLGTVTPDEFYRAVNHPERGYIRVDADELTYNLHLVLRFEIELALFRDELDVTDLPEAWNDKMEQHVGLRPDGDANGVLQDMHWAAGMPGYFPTYTLGTLYAAALFARAEKDLGDLSEELREGETGRLLEWLREKIHSQGYLYPAKELAEQVLGEPLSAQPYLDYLHSKYGELYDLSV